MIDKLIIKNFKSLKNVQFDLQKINLFIGPNNSGKTNVFKALEFLFFYILQNDEVRGSRENVSRIYFGFWNEDPLIFDEPVSFTFCKKTKEIFEYYIVEFWGLNENNQIIKTEFLGKTKTKLSGNFSIEKWEAEKEAILNFTVQLFHSQNIAPFGTVDRSNLTNYILIKYQNNQTRLVQKSNTFSGIKDLFWSKLNELEIAKPLRLISQNIRIYNPDPHKIKEPGLLGTDDFVNSDSSNLVSFFDNMRDDRPEIFSAIKKDLMVCLPEIQDIRFKKIKINNELSKQIVLYDIYGRGFLSDEVSEGILYFLALLAVIHQPKPPGLLLIEEPEKGIHPRRIHEIINFIFELADKKDIQIILTSHSPQVVNEFEDFPESVFVFDTENGKTMVKNLLNDIIEDSNKKSEKTGFPKIDYSQTLGEHWIYGLLGGVPK